MAAYTNTKVDVIGVYDNKARIRCTVSANTTSYYGILSSNSAICIRKASGRFRYWGWPKKSKWRSEWGVPSWILDRETYGDHDFNGPFGNLPGFLGDFNSTTGNYSYTWEEDVPITNRGLPNRTGSKQITVGIESNCYDSRFCSDLKTITVYTTSIPEGSISAFNVSIQGEDSERYIDVLCKFSNPEKYHYCKITSTLMNDVVSSTEDTEVHFTIPIEESMAQKTYYFEAQLYGKDNKPCGQNKKVSVFVEPNGVGVYTNIQNVSTSVNKMNFKNVNFKEIKEVWVRINGKWIKTKK